MTGPRPPSERAARFHERGWLQAVVVVGVCALVYWVRLGATGLSMSEGHRAIPGWEMLDGGEWLAPRMFGQVYLRKPPGVSWAIAASGAVFGETEFAARAPSALAVTGLALAGLAFGRRWYGARWGWGAGLGMALLPLLWEPGRSAEIEAIHTGAVVVACVVIVEAAAGRGGGGVRAALGWGAALGLGLIVAGLAKGPAGLPAIVGAMAGACLVRRTWRAVLAPAIGVGLGLGAVGLIVAGWQVLRAVAATGEAPVTQGPGEFLWSAERLTWSGVAGVLWMPVAALASGLPAVLAFPFAWARATESGEEGLSLTLRLGSGMLPARACGLACVLGVLAYAALGVDNPRYAMPAVALAPMLVPCGLRAAWGMGAGAAARGARVLALGRPWVWGVVLLAGAQAWVWGVEPRRREKSGRGPGVALAVHLPDGAVVWADAMIEARPELLWYAVREAGRAGRRVTVRWRPGMGRDLWVPDVLGALVVWRDGYRDSERDVLLTSRPHLPVEPVASGAVHDYTFTLYRITGPIEAGDPGP